MLPVELCALDYRAVVVQANFFVGHQYALGALCVGWGEIVGQCQGGFAGVGGCGHVLIGGQVGRRGLEIVTRAVELGKYEFAWLVVHHPAKAVADGFDKVAHVVGFHQGGALLCGVVVAIVRAHHQRAYGTGKQALSFLWPYYQLYACAAIV